VLYYNYYIIIGNSLSTMHYLSVCPSYCLQLTPLTAVKYQLACYTTAATSCAY